ncbi:hypothetical protein PT974_04906 [Cladobotryum mycophilum]|uniref:Uncharacterized protein n=1 Tax=Cladobotryum mycophilum TaxID=491253 RepID=A0ABR0SQI5_9HYPO
MPLIKRCSELETMVERLDFVTTLSSSNTTTSTSTSTTTTITAPIYPQRKYVSYGL